MTTIDGLTPESQFRSVMGGGRGSDRPVARVSELPIHRLLELSTTHLTEPECTALMSAERPELFPWCIPHADGFWVHVPVEADRNDAIEHAREHQLSFESLAAALDFAREHDCAWVNFDANAGVIEDLPTFSWSDVEP